MKFSADNVLERMEIKAEHYRGSGTCIRCEQKFPTEEFKILTNPETGEKRTSLLCNSCLEKARDKMLCDFNKRN